MHSNFETVTKVNVYHFTGDAFEQHIGRMSIPKTEDMSNHAIHCQRSGVCGTTLQPMLGVCTLKPQYSIKILASGILKAVFEDLDLLEEGEILVVRCHLESHR